jgi:hypothetical protein
MGLQIGYHLLNLMVFFLLCVIGFKAINGAFGSTPKSKRKKTVLIVGLILWQIYIFGLGQTELLSSFELPPRFVIFLIFPTFLFTGIFIYTNRSNSWLNHIPKSWLVYFQSFRIIVETLFVFSVAEGVLHSNVTIAGYNFDMILGFTAPLLAFLAFRKKIISEKVVVIWNYLGLAVLASVIFVFLTTTFFPGFYGSSTNLMPMEFTKYPYTLVAGFLMPVAVFIHLLSIVQLKNNSFESTN